MRPTRSYSALLLFALCACLFFSCTCNRQNNTARKEVRVIPADIHVNIVRFEQALFACHPETIEADLARLQQQYPLFYNVYYNQVLNIPSIGDKPLQLQVMKDFISKKSMTGLYDTVQKQFKNLDFLEKDLRTGFSNYKSYFPEKPVPIVFTCISEFSYSVFTATDSILGISLDKYLGPKYKYYPSVFEEFSYMIPDFDRKYMSIDCMNVLATNVVPPPDDKSTLLDKMLAEGKILFMIHSLLPDKKDNDLIKYSDKQWKWCTDNEGHIWSYFLDQKLLYDTRFEQFKYVKEGPNTYGMPKESPGKVGAWLGWQIVKAYMQKHPQTTLKQLIAIRDGQKILTESNYKPKANT